MNLKDFSKLKDTHAILSASNPSWLNYTTPEQFYKKYVASYAQDLGTAVHKVAENCINKKIKINKYDKHLLTYGIAMADIPKNAYDLNFIFPTFMLYVNDAIGYRMTAEQTIGYSEASYGTTDAIVLSDGLLRIHDLKTGYGAVHVDQLFEYAAFYCLTNDIDPKTLDYELRFYQAGDFTSFYPTGEEIADYISRTINGSDIMMKFIEEGKY